MSSTPRTTRTTRATAKRATKQGRRRREKAPRASRSRDDGLPANAKPRHGYGHPIDTSRYGYGYPLDTKVEFFRAYENASGVGCRISWGGYVFSFDVRGVVKHSLIKVPQGAAPDTRQIALELCTLAFLNLLTGSVDMAWRENNIRLHGVPR